MPRYKPISPRQDTIIRRLLKDISSNMDSATSNKSSLSKQAVAFKHFNGPNKTGFSHTSLGAKFRRYGK